jgi:hypothetical protein
MKKILSISNSFGEDATRYLYGLARSEKEEIMVVTLYIGGCSLYRHYRNMLSEEKAYSLCINGTRSGFSVSIKQALLSDDWDYVVLQQSSPASAKEETYFPYVNELSAYVKKLAPNAKQLLQMTWSFAEGCTRFAKTDYATRDEMIPEIRRCYEKAAKMIKSDGVIPSLLAMNKLYDAIGDETYRDGFHASYGIGRYMLACVWYMSIFGKKITKGYRDFDVEVPEERALLAERLAEEAVEEYGYKLI